MSRAKTQFEPNLSAPREAFRLVCAAQYRDNDIDFELIRRRALIARNPFIDGRRAIGFMRVAQRRIAREEIEEKMLAARNPFVKIGETIWKAVNELWQTKAH